MSFQKLIRLFSRHSNVTHQISKDVTLAPEIASAALSTAEEVWVDDTQLRELARESRAGITNWVLASDMSEFYAQLDRFNEGRPEEAKLKIEMRQVVHDNLLKHRENGMHITANHNIPKQGPILMDGEMLLRMLGPQSVNGLRARVGNIAFDASYSANPFNTCMSFKSPDGEWRDFQFGMDSGFVFKEVPAQILGPVRTIPAP